MKDVSAIGSYSVLQNSEIPWSSFIFLAVVFFAAQHNLFASASEQFASSNETIETAVREGGLIRQVAFSMLGFFGAVGLLRRGQNRLKIKRALSWFTLFYVVWASLSVAWADDVALTSRRVVVLWMLCVGALALGKHFSLRDIILWIFFTTAVYLLIGIVCEIAFGTFRPFAPNYRFTGTIHPNHQGMNCALLLLTGFAAGGIVKRGGAFFIVCAFVGMGFLVLTASRTAFVSGTVALVIYLGVALSRSSKLALLLAIGIGFCLLGLLLGDDLFLTLRKGLLLGRTDSDISSLTGRIPLWEEFFNYAQRRPLHGYGYASFLTPSRIADISAALGWGIPELHSAYFELLLSLGIIGLISFVMIMALGIKESIVRYKEMPSPGYASFIAIFVFCLSNAVLEAAVALNGILSFVAMVLVAHLGFTVPQACTSAGDNLTEPGYPNEA